MLQKHSVNTLTHIDTGVIGQNAVVGQRDILLLPLFVERVPTAFQQDALTEVTKNRRLRIYVRRLVCPSHRFRQHDNCWLPETPTILFIRPIWGITTHHRSAWWNSLHTFDIKWLLLWCPRQKVMKCIIFVSVQHLHSVSYLFDGNRASTAHIALTLCTPSVWVTASPALDRHEKYNLELIKYGSFSYYTMRISSQSHSKYFEMWVSFCWQQNLAYKCNRYL